MPLCGLILEVVRDILDGDILTFVPAIVICLHLKEIDEALELILSTDGYLDADGILAETVADHVQIVEIVGADDVHLVDERHARDLVGVRLTPDVFRLGFNAVLGVENANSAVQHAKGSLDLDREVHVSGGVDDVDPVLERAGLGFVVFLNGPVRSGSRRGDGDAALLLLCHPVHGGCAVVGLTDLVINTRIKQNTFRQGSLSGVNMRNDTDIPGSVQGVFSFCHFCSLQKLEAIM